jgi:hypothetical protein
MANYIVLYPLSLPSGPVLHPALEGEPPVTIDDATLFAAPSEFFTNEERATILINMGVIVPADAPELIPEAQTHLKDTDRKVSQSLRKIT